MRLCSASRMKILRETSGQHTNTVCSLCRTYVTIAVKAWGVFPEHDASVERFMHEGKLPEMMPILKKSPVLIRCQRLPKVLSVIYNTLEDYFNFLCPEAVSPRPPAYETVVFQQEKK